MSEQGKRLCQRRITSEQCGEPAAYLYRAITQPPLLLCEGCGALFAVMPWMKRRLTRLDATEGAHVVD